MDLYERIRDIAKSQGISINKMEIDLNFARSYISKFRKITPSGDVLKKIAEYLDVSVDALLGTELNEKDERDITKDLDNIMKKLTSGENGPASYKGEELDPDAAELFRDELEIALKRLKIINKEKYTPNKYKK
jgi:transcriptional regulator with XRE-family HTH domain